MSLLTAQKFIERLSIDPATKNHFMITNPRDTQSIVHFAHGKGFLFSIDELTESLRDYPPNGFTDELKRRMRV